MDRCGVGAVVGDRDAPQQVLGGALGDLLDDVEVTALVEHSHVGEFQLRAFAAEAGVLLADLGVGELGVRVLVERLGVGVGGGGLQVVVAFLDVFAVVALVAAEAEKAFLEDGVVAVPQGGGEAKAALAVAPALQAVLAPAVGPAAGVVVGELGPAVAMLRVVLAHRPPLALAEVGAPAFPVLPPVQVFVEAFVFAGHGRV